MIGFARRQLPRLQEQFGCSAPSSKLYQQVQQFSLQKLNLNIRLVFLKILSVDHFL
jgi:hypothetical protein